MDPDTAPTITNEVKKEQETIELETNEDNDENTKEQEEDVTDVNKVDTNPEDQAIWDKLKSNILAYTIPNRIDAQRALQRYAYLLSLRIQGIQLKDLADPDVQESMSMALSINMCLDREKDKQSIIVVKYNSIEQCEEARSSLGKKLSDHCQVKFLNDKPLEKDSPEVVHRMSQEPEINVENEKFLCVSDLPPGTTDAKLAEMFPFCVAAIVCRAYTFTQEHLRTQSQGYGYLIFRSQEELEKFVEDQKDWQVDIQGKLCPLTYSKPLNIQKKLNRSLHISERRLLLERIQLLYQQYCLQKTVNVGRRIHHLFNLCLLMEQDLEWREKENETKDEASATKDKDDTAEIKEKEETQIEKRVQLLTEQFLTSLEVVKKDEKYLQWSSKVKRGIHKVEEQKQSTGDSQEIVTEGAEKLLSSKPKKRKKKKNPNPEEMTPQKLEEQNLSPVVSKQERVLERRSAGQTDSNLNQALSSFTNTVGVLTSLVAKHLGPGSAATMQHPPQLPRDNSRNHSMNRMPNAKQHGTMQHQAQKRPLPQENVGGMGPRSKKVLLSSSATESPGAGGSVPKGTNEPAGRGKNYLQNKKKNEKRKLKRRAEAMQASLQPENSATSQPANISSFPAQRNSYLNRPESSYSATREFGYSSVREPAYPATGYTDFASRDYGYDVNSFNGQGNGMGFDRELVQSGYTGDRVLGYDADRYGDYY